MHHSILIRVLWFFWVFFFQIAYYYQVPHRLYIVRIQNNYIQYYSVLDILFYTYCKAIWQYIVYSIPINYFYLNFNLQLVVLMCVTDMTLTPKVHIFSFLLLKWSLHIYEAIVKLLWINSEQCVRFRTMFCFVFLLFIWLCCWKGNPHSACWE